MKKLILLILLLSVSYSMECDEGYTEIDGECYYQSDLDVLQEFIDNSSETIDMDMDVDSSGVIESIELGIQKWSENNRLYFLWIYDKQLSGEIPESIGNLTMLDTLNLSYNQLSGEIPESIGNLTNLGWLYLYLNQLSGIIPDTICNIYPNLTNFYIPYNQLCPPYPECLTEENIGVQDTSECINIGDLNGDLDINILDVVTLVNIIMDDGEYTEYGDMNYDGYLNILDVVLLVNIILEP